MATITIRNLPDDLVERLKLLAERNGRSMEQEVRELLRERCMTKPEAAQRIRERWKTLPTTSAAEVEAWRSTGREQMAVVIDTMVFAYFLLGIEPFRERAGRAIEEAESVLVPDGIFAELANVTWQWIRAKHIPIERGQELVADLLPLIDEVVPTSAVWSEAIQLSVDHNHPAYDTIFVAVAASRDTKVVTFDRGMIDRFPGVAISCDDFLRTLGEPDAAADTGSHTEPEREDE